MNVNIFKKRLIKKVPQIKDVEVSESMPETYEAYLYRYDNLENSKKYIGIHKGEIDDHYWNSSECSEFKAVYTNSKSKLKLSFVEFGDYEDLKTFEHQILESQKAKDSDDWYNNHNGSHGKQKIRMDKCIEMAERITSGEFDVRDENGDYIKEDKIVVHKLHRIQARQTMIVPEMVKEIRQKINDKMGNTDDCTPILIYGERIKNTDGDNYFDTIGDGNNTIEAVYASKAFDVPVARVPRSEHKGFSNLELLTIGGLLNPKPKITKTSTDKPDAVKHVVNAYIKGGLPIESEENYDYFDAIGFTNTQIRTIKKEAKDKIQEHNWRLNNKVFIEYSTGARKEELDLTVEDLRDKETFVTSASTEYVRLDSIMKQFRIIRKTNPNKKHIKVVIHHPKPSSPLKWDNKKSGGDVKLHQEQIDYWILPHKDVESFEWVVMDHLTDNKLIV